MDDDITQAEFREETAQKGTQGEPKKDRENVDADFSAPTRGRQMFVVE